MSFIDIPVITEQMRYRYVMLKSNKVYSGCACWLLWQFLDFLYSKQNSIFDLEHQRVVQNMDQPLNHYWIASSHNTYENITSYGHCYYYYYYLLQYCSSKLCRIYLFIFYRLH